MMYCMWAERPPVWGAILGLYAHQKIVASPLIHIHVRAHVHTHTHIHAHTHTGGFIPFKTSVTDESLSAALNPN